MPKRSVGLLVEAIEKETVIFDQRSQQIHRLEAEASDVFKSCDGTTSREVVAKNLYPDSENAVDRLDAVLAEMEELKLVETARVMDPSRRAFLKKAAAAAIATPLIHTFPGAESSPSQVFRTATLADPEGQARPSEAAKNDDSAADDASVIERLLAICQQATGLAC